MGVKKMGFGLGLFSVALGAAELLVPRRITRALDAEGYERLIRGYGARDVATGAAILMQPAVATGIWGRVAGDVLDLATLGLAARGAPRSRAVWGAIAFVVGVTVVDVVTAIGLDRRTGKTAPVREHAMA